MACESFITYADDKLMLADGINMDEEELWGLLIEGIPKGRIQCFADVRDIKRALAEVKLPKVYETDKQFQCNSKGHWAKECKKPQREKGSCYTCGEMGHIVATCQKNKKGEGNNYE